MPIHPSGSELVSLPFEMSNYFKKINMIKKLFLFIATLCMITQVAMAQDAEDIVYVAPEDLPDALYYLPAPPDTASYVFIDDMVNLYHQISSINMLTLLLHLTENSTDCIRLITNIL